MRRNHYHGVGDGDGEGDRGDVDCVCLYSLIVSTGHVENARQYLKGQLNGTVFYVRMVGYGGGDGNIG